ARSRAGVPVAATPVPVRAAVQRGVDLAVAAEARPSPVAVEGDDTVAVAADSEPLQRAVRNLVENALRYARERVTVTVTADQGMATIEVADDGPGFPAALLDGGLGRFEPGRNGREHPGGAGLGLAIVEAIVTGYGGSLDLGSREGGGAVARIHLPC